MVCWAHVAIVHRFRDIRPGLYCFHDISFNIIEIGNFGMFGGNFGVGMEFCENGPSKNLSYASFEPNTMEIGSPVFPRRLSKKSTTDSKNRH